MSHSQPPALSAGVVAPPWRLRVGHFLAWTAIAATLLAIERAGPDDESLSTLSEAAAMILPFSAVALALCGEGLRRRLVYGESFPAEPGHAVACLVTAWTAMQIAYQLLSNATEWTSDPTRSVVAWYAVSIAFHAPQALLCLWFALIRRMPGPWRWFFVCQAIVTAMEFGLMLFGSWVFARSGGVGNYYLITMAPIGLSLVLTAVTVLSDRLAGCRRPWHHWAGLVSWTATLLISLGLQIYLVVRFG